MATAAGCEERNAQRLLQDDAVASDMRDVKDGCRSVRRCKMELDLEAVLGCR